MPKIGIITLSGDFVRKHRVEILKLVENTEELDSSVDSTLRVINIVEKDSEIIIKTSSVKLARKIGERLCSTCGGKLTVNDNDSSSKTSSLAWSRG